MQWPWKAENDLDREVRHHLESLAEAYERQGMSRREALREAQREFGGVDRAKEECRDVRWWSGLGRLSQDLRFGWRMMRKTPAITLAAVVSLALGIGATTAIVSLADVMLWRMLPVPQPEQLGEVLWESAARPEDLFRGSSGSMYLDDAVHVADFFSKASFEAMRSRAAGKAEVAAHTYPARVSASFRGAVVVARLRGVSGNFFSMLGVQPSAGRLLNGSDDRPATPPSIVVTHRFWARYLESDPAVIGQDLRVNSTLYSVAGVLPAEFTGIAPGDETDIYTALEKTPAFFQPDSVKRKRAADSAFWWIQLMVRRAPGVTADRLRSLLDAAFASSWVAQPKSPEATPRIRLSDASRGLGSIRRRFGDPLGILLSLVALVLILVCANIANLLLARSASREKEVALRLSLGCGKPRLVRQLFTESLLLAVIGGALSIPVAAWLGALMLRLKPAGIHEMALSVNMDIRSLFAAAMVTLFSAILFGLYPALRSARTETVPALKEGTGSAGSMSRNRWTMARGLVLVQLSLGLLLATAAILFTGHLNEVINQETGFERAHVLLFDVRPGEVGYRDERLRRFYFLLEERLKNVPGVKTVGLARTRPLLRSGYYDTVQIPGNETVNTSTALHHGTATFLDALGVSILQGRAMTAQEMAAGRKVAVLSEDLLDKLDLVSPLGSSILTGGQQYEVIGVASQALYSNMTRTQSVVYAPFDYARQSATVVVRTSVPPLAVLGGVRAALAEIDSALPLVDVYTMEQQISRTLQRERLFAWLCGCFGALAIVLCVVGVYGLMSHTTARRTPEIGLRMAVGASRRDVMGQVLREGLTLTSLGLALGLPLALFAVRLGQSQTPLPEGPLPVGALMAAAGVLALAAILAVLPPAARAASVDPMRALRRS